MAHSKDEERDDEFKEIYGKEYTAPPRPSRDNPRDKTNAKKRIGNANASAGGSDEDNEPRDPNAIPTDFTSREAKVWEAKAKAIEKNWKRRKEEEHICRICGDPGHFTQGCPTTLGGIRKSGEIVERVPFKDKRLKSKLTGTGASILQSIEKDTGCHLRLEDNLTLGNGAFFVRVSGADRVMVRKGVDAVKKIGDQADDDHKHQNIKHSQGSYNFRSDTSPSIAAQMEHNAVQRMQHNHEMLVYNGRSGDEQHALEPIASQEVVHRWEAGIKTEPVSTPSFGLKRGDFTLGAGTLSSSQNIQGLDQEETYYSVNPEGRMNEKPLKIREHDLDLGYEQQLFIPRTLEELERRFMQETMELTKEQNEAEDRENARHRENLREIQERYQQKMTVLRAQQTKYREEFFWHEAQLRQQQQQYHQAANRSRYNYNAGAQLSDFRGASRDLLGYGTGIDGHPRYDSGYPYKEREQYYSALHPYNRNPAYDSGSMYPGKQGYDLAPYPPY